MRDRNDIICICEEVSYGDIIDAIDIGADTIEKLGDAVMAGITCGYCIEDLEEILEEELN